MKYKKNMVDGRSLIQKGILDPKKSQQTPDQSLTDCISKNSEGPSTSYLQNLNQIYNIAFIHNFDDKTSEKF